MSLTLPGAHMVRARGTHDCVILAPLLHFRVSKRVKTKRPCSAGLDRCCYTGVYSFSLFGKRQFFPYLEALLYPCRLSRIMSQISKHYKTPSTDARKAHGSSSKAIRTSSMSNISCLVECRIQIILEVLLYKNETMYCKRLLSWYPMTISRLSNQTNCCIFAKPLVGTTPCAFSGTGQQKSNAPS